LPFFLSIVLATGLVLLAAVAPLGALFGLVMSRGLTRRLSALSRAADAWSQGDFRPFPVDRSNDEIGVLGRRLQSMAERIQNLLQSQQELAVLEERHRLARDLHDTVKQQSFATLMQVRAARNLIDTNAEAASEHLTTAEGLLKSSQQELGLLISELRPAALEGQGLAGALRAYLNSWAEHTRIPAEIQVTSERRLPLAVEQTLYRVAQEALANVARHSRASAVLAQLAYSDRDVRLTILDNGVGFLPGENNSGFGLKSMRERVEEYGGKMDIASQSNQGTRVTAQIPLTEGKDNGKR
jgi:NarL family two-component system sensor histidine kinase LiaS